MIVATALMLLGLLGGIVAAQLRGNRMGGVVIVPLFAIYTLRTFGTLPVLLLSVLGGYVSVGIVKRRLFVYGRSLFVLSLVTSGLVSLLAYAFLRVGVDAGTPIRHLGFIGSVLPGIAAYNFHRLDRDERILDALWALTLLFFLVVVGIGMVVFVGLTPLATVTPPVMLAPESDIARAFGLVVTDAAHPVILPFPKVLGLLGLGLLLSEGVRKRWGLRIGGIIVLPLLVLFAFRDATLLWVYLLLAVGVYLSLQAFNWLTLVYARVLLSMGVIVGLLAVLTVVATTPLSNGLLPLLTGILGGVTAYNLHCTARPERRPSVVVAAGGFVALAAVARLFLTPQPGGILVDVTPVDVFAGVGVLALACWELYRLESIRPPALDEVPAGWEFEDTPPREQSP
jgi:hypothetical protein